MIFSIHLVKKIALKENLKYIYYWYTCREKSIQLIIFAFALNFGFAQVINNLPTFKWNVSVNTTFEKHFSFNLGMRLSNWRSRIEQAHR